MVFGLWVAPAMAFGDGRWRGWFRVLCPAIGDGDGYDFLLSIAIALFHSFSCVIV